MNKKLTRKEFLKAVFFSIIAVLLLPLSRLFPIKDKRSYKDAKFYKELAG